MRQFSGTRFILNSIMAFVLGVGIAHVFRNYNKQTKDKNKEEKSIYVFERENVVREVHTHTKYIGDSIIIDTDTTFIKRK